MTLDPEIVEKIFIIVANGGRRPNPRRITYEGVTYWKQPDGSFKTDPNKK